MSRRPIDLHVRELVLEGFPPGDHGDTLEAVRAELERLVAEGGLPTVGRLDGARSLDAGSFVVGPGSVGGQVARAIYGGLR